MSKSYVAAFKRDLGLGKNSRGKKPMSQLDEEEELEDDYESDSSYGNVGGLLLRRRSSEQKHLRRDSTKAGVT
jgi:hypothetical protein